MQKIIIIFKKINNKIFKYKKYKKLIKIILLKVFSKFFNKNQIKLDIVKIIKIG